MADNKTAIANIAGLSLGQELITGLTDNTPMAKKMNAIFEQVIGELLADDWFFNRSRAEIAVDSSAEPDFGRYDYAYALPSDCLFIRGLCDKDNDKTRYEYEREGPYLLTNQTSPIYLLYNKTLLIETSGKYDVSKMPLYFHRLISARIAYILAPNVTENQRIRGKIEIEWQRAYLNAREKNGEDAYVEGEQGDNDWRDGPRDYMDALI